MTSELKQRLRMPAVGLILVGALNAMSGMVVILGRLVSIAKDSPAPAEPARRLGYMTWTIVSPMVGLLSLIAAPVIIYGAVQMYTSKSYTMARLAAVLALIPLTSLCCIPGIPIGIWAFFVLSQPEVRAAFFAPQGGIVSSG